MHSIKGLSSQDAGVVKLVYTTDSKSVAFGRGGSSPPTGTIFKQQSLDSCRGFVVFGVYDLKSSALKTDIVDAKSTDDEINLSITEDNGLFIIASCLISKTKVILSCLSISIKCDQVFCQ